MQSSVKLNQVVQNISKLSIEEQFYLSELLQKRLSSVRINQIADRVREAEANYRNGNIFSGTVAELMNLSSDD